jgi:hypothetical protein
MTMVEKLKSYEEQCRTYYEHSINGFYQIFFFSLNKKMLLFIEFRDMLELFERTSSLMSKAELNEQIQHSEKLLNEIKQEFDRIFNEKLNETNEEKSKNFDQLRPTLGHPARKNDLQEIDNRERKRQNELQQLVVQLRLKTIVK